MTCSSCGAATISPDSRYCASCGSPLPGAEPAGQRPGGSAAVRKNVVVLFVDIVDSTVLGERLDPEPLRSVLNQYFALCDTSVRNHGGWVEKYIGDAVMALFGVPVVHEDDALRALRAAADIRGAVDDLNTELAASYGISITLRFGVNAGQAMVSSNPGGDLHVVGDTLNTASRLQAAALPGEILIGPVAAALVSTRVVLGPVRSLTLKGKRQHVLAWPLGSLERPENAGGGIGFVDRDRELGRLRETFQLSIERREATLVTVLGAPGLGKTRLVSEFCRELDGVTVLSGTCLSYGRGATYRPLVDMLKSLNGDWPGIAEALRGMASGERAVSCLSVITGLGGPAETDSGGVCEISWAVRCLFEALARRRPLIVVWDDLHWAETTLLDLIDEITTWLIDMPVLTICVARPELLQSRPMWGGGKPSSSTFEITPLPDAATRELVAALTERGEVSGQAYDNAEWISSACEGNPLFAELMFGISDDGGRAREIPPTIHALLQARLDSLPAAQREVLQRAAVVGRHFSRAELGVLCGSDTVDQVVPPLVRRRLLRRGNGDGHYSFSQALVRDVAYSMSAKADRVEWHLRIADSLAGARDVGEDAHRDIRAYHLESACLLHRELEPARPASWAPEAVRLLEEEGRTALRRKDLPGATTLLERACRLLGAGDPAHRMFAVLISDAYLGMLDAERATAALDVAVAACPGDAATATVCAIQRLTVAVRMNQLRPPAAESEAEAMLPGIPPGDNLSWCRLHQLRAFCSISLEHTRKAEQELLLALDRARLLGDRTEEDRLLSGLCEISVWGPTATSLGLALCDDLWPRFSGDRVLLLPVALAKAGLIALTGDFAAARRYLRQAEQWAGALHLKLGQIAALQMSGLVESLAGEHAAAHGQFLRGAAELRGVGRLSGALTLEVLAARELLAAGRHQEAASSLDALDPGAIEDDLRTSMLFRAVRAGLALSARRDDDAAAHAADAALLAERTDDLWLRGDVMFSAARVLHATGRVAACAELARRAAASYSEKGAGFLLRRVTGWMAENLPVEARDHE